MLRPVEMGRFIEITEQKDCLFFLYFPLSQSLPFFLSPSHRRQTVATVFSLGRGLGDAAAQPVVGQIELCDAREVAQRLGQR